MINFIERWSKQAGTLHQREITDMDELVDVHMPKPVMQYLVRYLERLKRVLTGHSFDVWGSAGWVGGVGKSERPCTAGFQPAKGRPPTTTANPLCCS
jgi:hypothetical protein